MQVALAVVVPLATLDRTGRASNGHPHDSLSASVKRLSVQVSGNKAHDVHARYEKDLLFGKFRTHLTARFRHPNPRERLFDSISLSGSLGDAYYEATRELGTSSETDLQLGYSLPSGVQLMADAKADGQDSWRLDRLSAFHVAGPFNVEPSYLPTANLVRLRLGRGGRWNGCPFSVQTEVPTDLKSPPNYEIGMRHEFDANRKLRARLLLPGEATARALWAEYRDAQIDKGGVWCAKANLPFGAAEARGGDASSLSSAGDLLRKAEFSVRRTWMW